MLWLIVVPQEFGLTPQEDGSPPPSNTNPARKRRYFQPKSRSSHQATRVACQIHRRSCRRTPETGVYFTQPPRRNSIARVLIPGSGMPKQKNALLKRPHTSLSTARPPGGVHCHHTTTTPRQRGGRHATGPVSAHRRDDLFRAAIYERGWRPSCIVRRSSSSSVASGTRTAIRGPLVIIRVTTAVSSLF